MAVIWMGTGRFTVPPPAVSDADAQAYLTAVEAADGQFLEVAVRDAINAFVVGCKADGIWTALKASCILAGARTLDGALVPLVGAAPTRLGTEGGWNYNREAGLAGNATNNYLNSNRAGDADPQDSHHCSVYATSLVSGENKTFINDAATTGGTDLNQNAGSLTTRNRNQAIRSHPSEIAAGLLGTSRNNSSSYEIRSSGSTITTSLTSQTPTTQQKFVFARNLNNSPAVITGARLAFYSIGESLDLALLDARVTTLINAIAAAIP